jgi:hypothetical protein
VIEPMLRVEWILLGAQGSGSCQEEVFWFKFCAGVEVGSRFRGSSYCEQCDGTG